MNASPSSELRQACPTLSIGVLSGGEKELPRNLELLERADVRMVHVDVMDGRFCPVTTGDIATVAAIETSLLKDVHLMVEDPIEHVAGYASAGADVITVHLEAGDPAGTLRAIGELPNANSDTRPILRGLAVLPATPLRAVEPLLDLADVLLVLAVTPGVAGRDPSAPARLSQAKRLASGHDLLVAFDGGVTEDDVAALVRSGADVIVSGSAVFGGSRAADAVLAAMQAQLQ